MVIEKPHCITLLDHTVLIWLFTAQTFQPVHVDSSLETIQPTNHSPGSATSSSWLVQTPRVHCLPFDGGHVDPALVSLNITRHICVENYYSKWHLRAGRKVGARLAEHCRKLVKKKRRVAKHTEWDGRDQWPKAFAMLTARTLADNFCTWLQSFGHGTHYSYAMVSFYANWPKSLDPLYIPVVREAVTHLI